MSLSLFFTFVCVPPIGFEELFKWIIVLACYFRLLPLVVWKYAFGAQAKISASNPFAQGLPYLRISKSQKRND